MISTLLLVANCGGPRFVLFFGKIEQKELHHGFGKMLQRVRADLGSDLLASNRTRGRKKIPIETLIGDLSSPDGTKRIAASAELFRRGKDVVPDLKKAGAKQVAPFGGSVDGTRRLDMVYSVIEGFPPNAPKARAGYRTNSFGLHVEKGATEEDIQKICKTHQCTLIGKFTTEGRPNCYLQIGSGKSLEAVIQQILSTEPKVTTINLNYFEG